MIRFLAVVEVENEEEYDDVCDEGRGVVASGTCPAGGVEVSAFSLSKQTKRTSPVSTDNLISMEFAKPQRHIRSTHSHYPMMLLARPRGRVAQNARKAVEGKTVQTGNESEHKSPKSLFPLFLSSPVV